LPVREDDEDELAPARGEAPAAPALSGLDDDGAPLGRAGDREGPARPEPAPLVSEPVDLGGSAEDAAPTVDHDGAGLPLVAVAEPSGGSGRRRTGPIARGAGSWRGSAAGCPSGARWAASGSFSGGRRFDAARPPPMGGGVAKARPRWRGWW